MNIKITADSTCDLPAELRQQHNITLADLIVTKDDKDYYDNVTITPADIFAHVAAGGDLCKTAALGVGVYEEFFGRFAKEYDAVIHISLGSGFSSSYQNACLAADEFDNVYVIDSQSLSTGQGCVVLEACKLASSGINADQIVEELNDFVGRVEISFMVENLTYLVKGGRCSSAAALGANLLNLKPCIELKDGKMSVGKKYRGNYDKCLATYIKDRLTDRDDIEWDKVFITYTPVSDTALDLVKSSLAELGHFATTLEAKAGCTISCHCGPGTLGIIFVRKA
jgi:DegV family protein with EDD domain